MFIRPKFIVALLLTVGIMAVGQPKIALTASGRPALYEFGAGFCFSCKEMESEGR